MSNIYDPGEFLFVMTRTARFWRMKLDLLLSNYGLTEASTRPLIYIARLGEGIRQKDLALELEVEGSSLVRLLDSLEKNKLIRRKVGKNDRRERKLYLTAEGKSVVTHVHDLTNALHNYVLQHVAEADRQASMRALTAINRALVDAAAAVDHALNGEEHDGQEETPAATV